MRFVNLLRKTFMKKAPKVVQYEGKNWYKSIKPYTYVTRPGLHGYSGGYWTYEYSEEGKLEKVWLFQCVELAEWQVEHAFLDVLKHWKIIK